MKAKLFMCFMIALGLCGSVNAITLYNSELPKNLVFYCRDSTGAFTGTVANISCMNTTTLTTPYISNAAMTNIGTGIFNYTFNSTIIDDVYACSLGCGSANPTMVFYLEIRNLSQQNINYSATVGSVTGAVGSVTGNVGGNVVGSVGSVSGAVGSVSGACNSVTSAVTCGTVSDKIGYSLAANQNVNSTTYCVNVLDKSGYGLAADQNVNYSSVCGVVAGNIGGNVNGSVGSVIGAVSLTPNQNINYSSTCGVVSGDVGGNVNGSVGSVTGTVSLASNQNINSSTYCINNLDKTGYGLAVNQNVNSSAYCVNVLDKNGYGLAANQNINYSANCGQLLGDVGGNVNGTVSSVVGSVGSILSPVSIAAGQNVNSSAYCVNNLDKAGYSLSIGGIDDIDNRINISHGAGLYNQTNTLSAADIWSYSTRTLSDYSGVWSYSLRSSNLTADAITGIDSEINSSHGIGNYNITSVDLTTDAVNTIDAKINTSHGVGNYNITSMDLTTTAINSIDSKINVSHGIGMYNLTSITALDVWTYTTRTLNDYSGVWSYVPRSVNLTASAEGDITSAITTSQNNIEINVSAESSRAITEIGAAVAGNTTIPVNVSTYSVSAIANQTNSTISAAHPGNWSGISAQDVWSYNVSTALSTGKAVNETWYKLFIWGGF